MMAIQLNTILTKVQIPVIKYEKFYKHPYTVIVFHVCIQTTSDISQQTVNESGHLYLTGDRMSVDNCYTVLVSTSQLPVNESGHFYLT